MLPPGCFHPFTSYSLPSMSTSFASSRAADDEAESPLHMVFWVFWVEAAAGLVSAGGQHWAAGMVRA